MSSTFTAVVLLAVGAASFYYSVNTTPREASLLLVNGTIYTLDSENSIAEALAIKGNRIVAVGSSAAMRKSFPTARVFDLGGATVLPGFIDGHGHIDGEGMRLQTLDLYTKSAEEIAEIVRQRAQESPPSWWIQGRGWDQNVWTLKQFPDRSLLDRVAPNNPVVLRRVDGHAYWVNSAALQLAGISSNTPDPEGGKIQRDSRGQPTGILIDNAMDLMDKTIPLPSDEELEHRIRLALNECARSGLTEVHDMGADLRRIRVYRKLIDAGECPIRLYVAIDGPGETWEHYKLRGPEIDYGNGMLTVRTLKLYIDGALGSRGAALFTDYDDDPGNTGLLRTGQERFHALCAEASQLGFQVCTHAIGDRGNNITLNEYERILSSVPMQSESPRWRIEHVQILKLQDIPRFHQYGILPSMQPTHCTSDMYWAEARIGAERIVGAYAWQSILKTGSIIIGGSDFPVESVHPLWGFYAAITRSDHAGYPQDGWHGSEKMSRLQAARAFTTWAAYGAFQDEVKGTIEAGKWADLVMLSKDVMQVPPLEILKTDVEMTMVGGKIVYAKSDSPLIP
jgi:predicted amidohydrolase YtcJ